MASKEAHETTGWAAGVMAAAVVEQVGNPGPYHMWAVLAFLMGGSGGTAPDWMELSWWRKGSGRHSWIPHRTLTHWGIAWIALLLGTYHMLPRIEWMAIPFGFAAGGLMHLLADFPNPMGIPWLLPNTRHSLRLWNSGRCDFIVVALAWTAAAAMADQAWFDGTGLRYVQGWSQHTTLPHRLWLDLKSNLRDFLT